LLLCLAGTRLGADTYPRQPIDIDHYRFALTLSDTTDRIEGEATIRLRVLEAGVKSVAFDLADASPERDGKGMTVQGVTSGGQALAFTHAGDRVTITLAAPSRKDERAEFIVRYGGIPADGLQIKPNPHGDRTF